MSIVLFKYRFTTINSNTGTIIISNCWLSRRVNFSKPQDYLQVREELCGLECNRDDEDMQGGVLTNAELCGIKLFGIRVL